MTTPQPERQPDWVEALNTLLEDERASVEMEVALASDATEYLEREALSAMGSEDVLVCSALRERMEHLALPVSRQINGIVLLVLELERYDDRLRAFAEHQMAVGTRAEALLAQIGVDRECRRIVQGVQEAHQVHALWCLRRAEEFGAIRTLDLRNGLGILNQSRRRQQALAAATPLPVEQPTELPRTSATDRATDAPA